MNYTNYIGTLRNNLCYVLTATRDNEKKIKKIRENIENIELLPKLERPTCRFLIREELNMEIEFYETINDVYSKEANRLIGIILDKPIEVQDVCEKNERKAQNEI